MATPPRQLGNLAPPAWRTRPSGPPPRHPRKSRASRLRPTKARGVFVASFHFIPSRFISFHAFHFISGGEGWPAIVKRCNETSQPRAGRAGSEPARLRRSQLSTRSFLD